MSGLRTLVSGERTDSLTSQGLQAAGVERNTANLVDAGISVAGTLGASAAVRAPAVGGEVAVSLSPGFPVGHNAVRVTTASGASQASHLVIESGAQMSSGLPAAGTEAFVVARSSMHTLTASAPVTASGAEAALASSEAAVLAEEAGTYCLTSNSCTTYAAQIAGEAGLFTLPVNTPATLFATTALQSPAIVQPLASTGAAVNASVGVAESVTPVPGSEASSETGEEADLDSSTLMSTESTGSGQEVLWSEPEPEEFESLASFSPGESPEELATQMCY